MDRKTSFVFYPSEFFSAVYNFKKSQIADLIIALCEINYYGKPLIKLSDIVKVRLDRMQESIDKNNAKYKEICEKRQISGAKGGSKRQGANAKAEDQQIVGGIWQIEGKFHRLRPQLNVVNTSK